MRGQQHAPAALYLRERPGTHCTGDWVGPGPVWAGGKSRHHRDSIPDRPARKQSLYRLSYPAHNMSKAINIGLYMQSNTEKTNKTTFHALQAYGKHFRVLSVIMLIIYLRKIKRCLLHLSIIHRHQTEALCTVGSIISLRTHALDIHFRSY